MSDEETAITAEELSKWLAPLAAYRLLKERLGPTAAEAISGRLKGGLIRAAARSSSWERLDRDPDPTGCVLVPARYWTSVSTRGWKNFWATGDLRIFTGRNSAFPNAPTVIRYYGVRFDPAAIQLTISDKPAISAVVRPSPQSTPEKDAEAVSLKKPSAMKLVPVAHLIACFEAYRKIYTGPANTEDAAMDFARRMFPDHSFTRKQVRDLRGPATMGRPKESTE